MPLRARNAFVDGFFGLGVRRRPAWVEGGVDIAEKREERRNLGQRPTTNREIAMKA
jgi:hypothetical protein